MNLSQAAPTRKLGSGQSRVVKLDARNLNFQADGYERVLHTTLHQ